MQSANGPSPPARVASTLPREMRLLLDSTDEGLYAIDRDGRCTFINQAGAEMLGYGADEPLGRDMHELIHHSRTDGAPYPTDDCPIYQAFRTGAGCRVNDEVLWRRDGRPFAAEYSSHPIEDEGSLQGAVVTFRDITAHRRSEAALHLLRTVTTIANEASDITEALTGCLQEICDHTPWTVGHAFVQGETDGELVSSGVVHAQEPARVEPFLRAARDARFRTDAGLVGRVLETGTPQQMLDLPDRADFLRREAAAAAGLRAGYAFPVFVGPEVVAVLEFFSHDDEPPGDDLVDVLAQIGTQLGRVVERQRAAHEAETRERELARSNAELEQFAYVASHDLQEPLRKIAGYVQLLAKRYEGRLDDDADDFIGYAVDGTQRMQQLIDDLLAFSRAGRPKDPPEPTDCTLLVKDAVSALESRMVETGAEVTYDPLPTIRLLPRQMTQVFLNLIGNALKYRGTEPPRIHVGVEEEPRDWRFAVRDNGIGIDPEYADRVFEIFQRLHTRDEYGGTGIGLALCRRIVEHHGGQIWIEEGTEPGTTVVFTLPKGPQADAPTPKEGSHG